MATNTLTGGFRPVTLPNQFPPVPAVMRILSRFDRDQLHGFIAVAIDLADAMDGDADDETCALEDDATPMPPEIDFGPGCAIADSDAGAWVEWHTKPANTRRRGQPEYMLGEEDEEEDDPHGVHDEDGINTCFDVLAKNGAGCPISDPGGCEHDGREPDEGGRCIPYGIDQTVLPRCW